jgi:hypothetical protein
MIEVPGDLWERYGEPGHVICITTNGCVRKDGRAVMGAGVALEAQRRAPLVPMQLALHLGEFGNRVCWLDNGKMLAFPTKEDWRKPSILKRIKESATQLLHLAEDSPNFIFHLPRPGCGCGGLKWEQVKPLLEDLPNNVWVHGR